MDPRALLWQIGSSEKTNNAKMKNTLPCTSDLQKQLVELVRPLAPVEGYNLTVLPDVRILRSDRPLSRAPVLYDPGIVIVLQGRKRGFLGDEVYLYDAQHYLAVSVPVPFSMETDASADEPLLAIYLRLDFKVAAELMMKLDECGPVHEGIPRGLMSTPMDEGVANAVLRFLKVMNSSLEAAILGPDVVREIYFRVLTSEQGSSIRAALTLQGHFGKITKAIRTIHASFDQKLDIGLLADEAGMSPTSFHAHFKAVTSTSPIQYLKTTRLHQARLIMVRNGVTAAMASAQVGYESPSQFSREFKRMFGRAPSVEAARMKQAFARPDPSPHELYVAAH